MGGKDEGKKVLRCLKGKAKTAYGHHWRYVDDESNSKAQKEEER